MKSSILEYIYSHSQSAPDKPCIIEKDTILTYRCFWHLISGFCAYLKTKGLQPGECVVAVAEQSAAFLVAGFAAQLAGGIFVPVEKGLNPERLSNVAAITGVRIIISGKAPEIDCVHIPMEKAYEYKLEDESSVVFPDGDATSEILFTTGTTGASKGVELSYVGTLAAAENVVRGVEMKPDNIELIPIPINHSNGLRRCYANLLNGSTIVLAETSVFMKPLFEMMEKHKVTALALVPAAVIMILKMGKDLIGKFSNQLDYIQISSSALPECDKQMLCELLPNSRIYNIYGSAEAGCSCIIDYNTINRPTFCIGNPTKNSSIIFVNENRQEFEATKDKPGFIATSGKMLMKGYYKDPDSTDAAMKDGYVCSQDVAYRGDDGYIYLLGRRDDVINVGGKKISPSEIEEKIMLTGTVEDCACVPMEDHIAGQVPKLFIVMKQGQEYSEQEIYQFLSRHLEPYKLPKMIVPIEKIPRTYNGKLQRNQLT